MNKNVRRPRAIAIAETKPDEKAAMIRHIMIATGATAAAAALLIAHLL